MGGAPSKSGVGLPFLDQQRAAKYPNTNSILVLDKLKDAALPPR